MTEHGPLPTVRRHPFLGAAAGLVLGTAMTLWLVLYGAMALGTWPPVLVPIAMTVAGVAWGLRGPVRRKASSAPAPVPAYNERVQQALEQNEAVIGGEGGRSTDEPPMLPGIGPPESGDHADWHRRDPGESGPRSGPGRA